MVRRGAIDRHVDPNQPFGAESVAEVAQRVGRMFQVFEDFVDNDRIEGRRRRRRRQHVLQRQLHAGCHAELPKIAAHRCDARVAHFPTGDRAGTSALDGEVGEQAVSWSDFQKARVCSRTKQKAVQIAFQRIGMMRPQDVRQ